MDVDELIDRHIAVWTTSDPVQREAAIAQLYAEDVEIVEPDRTATVGRAALSARIGELIAQYPGMTFTLTAPNRHHHNVALYSWTQLEHGAPAGIAGTDMLMLADGRITAVYMFMWETP